MCLAVPARVIEIYNDQSGLVEMSGIRKKVSLELTPEATIDDYVIIHVGYALSLLDKEEAMKTIKELREISI